MFSGFDVIFVTNRALCQPDETFIERIEKLATARPDGIILREKDLPEVEYLELAAKVTQICDRHEVPCILHRFPNAAMALGCTHLHMPLATLRTSSNMDKRHSTAYDVRRHFAVVGASCHSVEDAREAEGLGCNYITAGHIYDTDCKRGLPGRGVKFLQEICTTVKIPVYAIGGIGANNISEVRSAGAAGICVMSGAMKCVDTCKYLESLRQG